MEAESRTGQRDDLHEEKSILLVEDSWDDEALTLRALSRSGIRKRVDVARDGSEAMDRLFSGSPDSAHRPTLILLDIKLPKIDGLEILRRIRSDPRTKMIPVIILSSSNEECDLRKSYEFGVNSYILKPVDFDEFLETVTLMMKYWLDCNQYPVDQTT